MHVVILSKRCPQSRDLLLRPYGRFFYLAFELAQRRHKVSLLLLSYGNNHSVYCCNKGLEWYSENFRPVFSKGGTVRYLLKARDLVTRVRPDWVFGFSDVWYGILAQKLAERSGCRSLIDAYDNYESYIPWLKPVHWVWRRAIARADVVTASGPHLADLLGHERVGKPTVVIPMAADPDFSRRDRGECRQRLGLPKDKKLIGYFGSLYGNRGIEVLFEAFRRVRAENREVELVLSGRADRERVLPEGTRWMGYVADMEIPWLVGAVDVATVVNRPGAFGSYSCPAKLYEAMACGIPVVASDTPAARWILKGRGECLAVPGNAEDLRMKLVAALDSGYLDYGPQAGWPEITADLEDALLRFGGPRRSEV